MIDTHSHLNFNSFKNDAHKIIEGCLAEDLWMINIGTNLITSQKAVKLTEKYDQGVTAAVGLHPISLDTGLIKLKPEEDDAFEKEFDYEKYKELAQNPKVVALGEIGLDYWHKPKSKANRQEFKNLQKDLFIKQLDLAKELSLPVIVHCRMAFDDLLEIVSSKTPKGVIHCFSGTWEQAQKLLNLGFYLGFNGIIFKLNLDEVIKKIPANKILVETDCPYLTPPQESGRNEPIFIKHVVQRIADIKNEDFAKIAEISTRNAKKLFKIN